MVNTVNSDALKTLLSAQNASSQNSLAALKKSPQPQQSLTSHSQQNSATPVGAAPINTAPGADLLADAANNPPPSNLPRGSLVDIIA